MKFTYFKFRNFKGIEDEKLVLAQRTNSKIFSLVGLNESGKTTILEAMNFFSHKPESLDMLGIESYSVEDIHSLIPINKRDKFNDKITIEAGLEISEELVSEIKTKFKRELNIRITKCGNQVTYTQNYHFKNSIHQPEKDESWWTFPMSGKKGKQRKERELDNSTRLTANSIIKANIPSILYFPNFLFEFPERIYIDESLDDAKHKFYQKIIQDILDSLKNETNIKEHLLSRIESEDPNEKRNLESLKGKMEARLTRVIFKTWNEIFNKQITKKEIKLNIDKDGTGSFVEFKIKDDIDTFRVHERSLGFRWFFVYILLTQFRSYRKGKGNALFLFDEPASNLHPSAQIELLNSFENLPGVLYTTHSHYLINPKWLENTYVIKNRGIDYDNEEDFNPQNTDVRIYKYREFATNYPNQTNYFQPILEVLDYRPTNLELVPKAVLLEGKTDFYLLSYYQNVLSKEGYDISFIPGTSASNLESLISLYLGWGKTFVIILDSDKEGKKQRTRYIDNFGEYISDIIQTLEDVNPLWSNHKLESLLKKSEILEIQKMQYPDSGRINKKLFHRSVQELLINKTTYDFSSETIENFEGYMEFVIGKLA